MAQEVQSGGEKQAAQPGINPFEAQLPASAAEEESPPAFDGEPATTGGDAALPPYVDDQAEAAERERARIALRVKNKQVWVGDDDDEDDLKTTTTGAAAQQDASAAPPAPVIIVSGQQEEQAEEQEPEDPDISEEEACVVCLSRRKSYVCVPCGHLCLCAGCARDFTGAGNTCPLCRKPVGSLMKVFQ